MEAKELRIGNFIFNGNNQIVEINIDRLRLLEKGINYEPIPLTQEWLLKFGFKKQKAVYIPVFSKRTNSKIWFSVYGREEYQDPNELHINDPKKWFSVEYNKFDVKIKYIHQLQNIYWCLTGEELTLKE